MRRLSSVAVLLMCLPLALAGACGDESTGGMAGSGGEPALGDPCGTSASCPAGLVCSSGTMRGTCSVGCTGPGLGDSACKTYQPDARCVGASQPECALGCTSNEDCIQGTLCGDVGGTMVCVRDR